MEIQFGIHQDLWQDAWIAATSAVRAKKRQIDLNVEQRVQRLISDHSPGTGKALTLRVYGTMIKGFCVINNDRARILHADCERVILLFAEQPYSEGLKLPTAKRQRVDAVTLDLDVARVKEAEAFDWTQTPLGSELLQLGSQELPDPQEVSGWAMEIIPSMPSLLEVTEAFPAQPPDQQPLDQAEADVRDGAVPGELALGAELGAELGEAELDLRDPEMGMEAAKKRRRRHPPVPGYVHGWDEETTAELPAAVALEPRELASLAEGLQERAEMFADHLGSLQILVELREAVGPEVFELSAPPSETLPELPDVQPLLSDQIRPEMLGAIFAQSPQGDAFMEVAAQAAESEALVDVSMEAEAMEGKGFDAQTSQVGTTIRKFVEESEAPVMLDDLMPPSITDKVTAARTFGCLLALATGGGLQVHQDLPYGPISIALA